MITLYGFGPGFGLPEISPYVTKTEVQLKMMGLDYVKQQAMPDNSPKGQLPFIDDGEVVADSTFIRRHLERQHDFDLDAGLAARQRAAAGRNLHSGSALHAGAAAAMGRRRPRSS